MVPRRVAALLSVSAVLSSSGSVLAESPSALAVATIARASFSGPDEEGRRPLPLAPLTDEGASRPREAHTAKPLQVGALAGVGFPNLMSLGVTARVLGVVGLGANMGRLPETDVPIYGQATVAYRSWDAYARVYPIAGLFFGAGLGRHTITGTASRSFDVPYAAELGVPSTLGVSTRAEVSVLVAMQGTSTRSARASRSPRRSAPRCRSARATSPSPPRSPTELRPRRARSSSRSRSSR